MTKPINSLECNLVPPSVNHLYQTYSKNGKIIRTMTKEGLQFKKALSLLAKAKKFKLIEGDCSLEYTLYCSKCNNVRQINGELHCSLNMQDGKTFSTYSKVTFKECSWYREKRN